VSILFEHIVKCWNEPLRRVYMPSPDALAMAAEMYRQGLIKQYVDRQQKEGLRLSGLGKPALDIFARKFHPEWFTTDWQTERLTQLFHAGDTFEADMYVHLDRFGYEIEETQQVVSFNGVTGHSDFIVRDAIGQRFLLELKTCAGHRFTQMCKGINCVPMPYRTQLALYQQCLGIDSYWCFYNKDNSEIAFQAFDPAENQHLIRRAEQVIAEYARITEWDEVFNVFCAPPPEGEKYKNTMTGNFKVPQDIDKQLAPHIYEVIESRNNYGKMTSYVTGYRMPDGSVEPLDIP